MSLIIYFDAAEYHLTATPSINNIDAVKNILSGMNPE